MNKIANFTLKYSILIIISVIILTLLFGYYALQIDIKAGIKDMLPENNPVVETFDQTFETFGGMAYAVIMLQDEDIIDQSSLQKIDQLTKELEEIKGVQDVKSLTNIKKINGTFLGIEVDKLIKRVPENKNEIEQLKSDLLHEEQYLGKIISRDFKSTIILANLEEQDNPEDTVKIIKKTAVKFQGPEKVYLTGSPVMVTDATEYMKSDLVKLLPFVIAAIIIILMVFFRSMRGVLLPMATVLISVVWAVGLQALLGKSLSIISTVLPVLLVSVGSAYAIHIVARYDEELLAGREVEAAVSNTIKKVGIAVIMAGGTTMIGFASLFFSDLSIIQDFALGTAFGVGVALLISLFFVPALLFQMRKPEKCNKVTKENTKDSHLEKLFKGISYLVIEKRFFITITVIVLIIGSVTVLPRLKPETNYISYFKKTSETRIATEKVDEIFGGSQPVDVVIHGNIKDVELLQRMNDFQNEADQLPHVNNPLSVVNILQEENKALNGDDEAMKVLPESSNQVAQFLLLLEMSDKSLLENFVTFDYETTRIELTMETLPTSQQSRVLDQLQELINKHFADKYEVELTGIPTLADEVTRMVVQGQVKSLLSAIILTFVVTSLLLRSIKRGFFTSLPIALTVLINFGIMGWLGISLDIATVMIASLAVGIGVDYSIHIFTRYLEEKEIKEDSVEALKTAIHTVGRANLLNAAAVIAGFCVILFSSFPPLVSFGGLTAVTMVISFLGALFILPALIMSTINIVNKAKERINSLKA